MTDTVQRISVNNPSGSQSTIPNFPASAGVPLTSNVPNLSEDVDRRIAERLPTELPPTPPIEELNIPETEVPTFTPEPTEAPPPLPSIEKMIPIPKPGPATMLTAYEGIQGGNPSDEVMSVIQPSQMAMGAQLFGGVMGQTIPLTIGMVALSAAVQALSAIVASIPGGSKVSLPKLPIFNPLTMAENLNSSFQQVEQIVQSLEAQYGGLSREELDEQRDEIREQTQPLFPFLAEQETWRFRAWFCAPEYGVTTDIVDSNFFTVGRIDQDNPPKLIQDYIDMLEDDVLVNNVKISGQEDAIYMTAQQAESLGIINFASSPTVSVTHLSGTRVVTYHRIIYKPVFIQFKYQKYTYFEDPNKVINLPSTETIDKKITSSEVAQKIVDLNREFQLSTKKHTGTDYFITV